MTARGIYAMPAIALLLVLALTGCRVTTQTSLNSTLTPVSGLSIPTPTYALATPYAQQPAAGICASFDGTLVTITINVDVPEPRCTRVRPSQTLKVVNATLNTIQVTLGQFSSSIAPGADYSIAVPFGEYLATGVHQLMVTPGSGAELWLEASK
jgi:hypothetical protein